MVNWEKVRIGQFLREREGRYRPTDETVRSLKRLDKIDFSGNVYLTDKDSRTDMIIIEPGDLVISGINVSKGAVAVYYGEEPITATIHYSSYAFDKNRVDINYFKRFIKSQSFAQVLKDQVKGGIKTEIKPKHLLSLEILLPGINKQKETVSFFDNIEEEIHSMNRSNNHQRSFITKLRQQVLQEAVEGKLTAKWRREHPELVSGDNHASRLLERIRSKRGHSVKKGKTRKEMAPAGTTGDKRPFELPEGWTWARFFEVCTIATNGVSPFDYPNHLHVSPDNIDKNTGRLMECGTVKEKNIISVNHLFYPGMLVYSKVRPRLRKIVKVDFEGLCSADMYPLIADCDPDYLKHVMLSEYFDREVYRFDNRVKMPKINQDQLNSILIPLAPQAEQLIVSDTIATIASVLDELEKQVFERKELTEMLMQSVLREAFAAS